MSMSGIDDDLLSEGVTSIDLIDTGDGKRANGMSQFEKNLLLELIKKNKIVEDKKFDFGTITKKQTAWDFILVNFILVI